MKSHNLNTNAQKVSGNIARSDVPEEGVKNGPTPAEIRHRAFEIQSNVAEFHGCDLDDWLQAERELQEKLNKSNDGGPKKK